MKNISFTYIFHTMPANPLNAEQLAEAAQLKKLFLAWQKRRRENDDPISQEGAAALLGFNQSSLSQYLNGRIPLNVDAATKLATLIGCPLSEFSPALASQAAKYAIAADIHAESPALGEIPLLPGAKRVTVGIDDTREMTAIKKVNLTLQAGIMGFEATQEFDNGGTLDVPTRWVEDNDLVPQCLLAIRVKGDSMQPLLYEKDIVVVNIADTKRVTNGVYALNFNGEAVIKRLVYEDRDWYMTSENRSPEHRRRLCRGGECIIVGRVVRFEAVNFKDRL